MKRLPSSLVHIATPIGFFVTTFGFATYLLARGVRWAREERVR